MFSLPLTPKSPYSGTGQEGVPLILCCSYSGLKALGKLLQTRLVFSSQAVIWELTPQLPSAGKWLCVLLAARTCRTHWGAESYGGLQVTTSWHGGFRT